jgi:hypothetical protein
MNIHAAELEIKSKKLPAGDEFFESFGGAGRELRSGQIRF